MSSSPRVLGRLLLSHTTFFRAALVCILGFEQSCARSLAAFQAHSNLSGMGLQRIGGWMRTDPLICIGWRGDWLSPGAVSAPVRIPVRGRESVFS